MFYEIQLDFILSNFDIDPTRISEMISLAPTRSWLKGESIQKTTLKRKTNGWLLSSGLDKRADLEDHLEAFFSKIKPVLLNFNNLPSTVRKRLSCAIYIYHSKMNSEEEHSTPAIYLEREQIGILNELGAEFDIDLYILPKD